MFLPPTSLHGSIRAGTLTSPLYTGLIKVSPVLCVHMYTSMCVCMLVCAQVHVYSLCCLSHVYAHVCVHVYPLQFTTCGNSGNHRHNEYPKLLRQHRSYKHGCVC